MDPATLAELGAVPAEGGAQPTPQADNPEAGSDSLSAVPLSPDVLPEWTSSEQPANNQPMTAAAGAAMAAPGVPPAPDPSIASQVAAIQAGPHQPMPPLQKVSSDAAQLGGRPAAPSPADLAELGAVPADHNDELGAQPLTPEQAAADKNFDWRKHAESVDPDENPAGAANAQEFAAQVKALRDSGKVKQEGRTAGEMASAAGGGLLQAGKTVATQGVGVARAIGSVPIVAELAARQVAAEAAMTSANQRGDKEAAAAALKDYQWASAELARVQAESSASLELGAMSARKLVGTVLSPAGNELTPDQEKFLQQKQLAKHQQDLANLQAQLDADPTNPLLRDMVKKLRTTVAFDAVDANKPVDPQAALDRAREDVLNHVSEVAQRKQILAGRGEIAKGNIPGLPASETPEQLAAQGQKFNEPTAIESALGTTPVEAMAPAADMLAYGPVFGATGKLIQLGGATRVGGAILGAGEKVADAAGAATRQVLGRTVQAAVSTPAKFAAGVATGGQFGHELLGGWLGKMVPTKAIGEAAKDFATAAPDSIPGAIGDWVGGKVSQGLKAGAQGVVAGAPFIATSDDPAAAVGENFGFGLLFGMGGKGEQDRARALQNSRYVTQEGLNTLAQDPQSLNALADSPQAIQTAGLWQGILQRLDPRIRMRVLGADDFAAEAKKRDPNAQNADQARGFFDPATNEVVVNGTRYLGEVAGHEGGHALFGEDMAKMLPQVLQQKLADSVDAALLQPKKDAQGNALGGQAAIGQPTPLLRRIAARYGEQLGRQFDLTNPKDIEYLRNELIAETSRSLTTGEGDLAKFFAGPAAGQRGAEYLRDRLKDIFPRFAQNNFEFGMKEAPQVTQAVRASLYELGKIAREGTNQANPEADEAAHAQAEAARTPGTPEQETARADSIKALRALGYKASQAAKMVDDALASSEPTENSGQLTAAALKGANAGPGRATPAQASTLTPTAPNPYPAGHPNNPVRMPTGPRVQVPDSVSFNDNSGSVPTQYRVVEASDVEADPNNERPQAGTPAAVQLQQRNQAAVSNFDPTKVINTSPSPSNGPAIVYKVMGPDGQWTGKYRIAGGHQRTEIIKQAGDKYTEAVKAQGQAYDPDYDPSKVQQPLLVREIDAPADERSRADLVRRLNDTETAGQDAVSNAVSAGRLLTPAATQSIAATASNPVGTPRANLLASDTRELRAEMQRSGIIRPQDMERMVAPDGRLTAEGVDLALQATVASVLGDAATIRDAQRKAPGILGKLETILPQILRAQANGVDVGPIAEAVRLEVERGSQSVADFQAQPPVVGPVPSREAMRIQQILAEQSGQGLRDAMDKVVSLTAPNEAGQASMFGENRKSIGDLTDQELSEILGGQRVTQDLTPRITSPLSENEQPAATAPESPASPLGTAEPAETPPPAPQEAPRQISTLTPRVSADLPVKPAGENAPSAEIQSTPPTQTRSITLPPISPAVKEAAGEGTQSPLGEKPGDTAPLEAIDNHLPGVTTPSKESRSIWGRIKGMLPKFQGNKTVMGDYVVSAIRRYWSPEQRAKITTIVDSFAGGGAWGFGLGETGLFPNVNRYIINEFDAHRAVRIRQQYENGDKFATWARDPEVQAAMQAIVDAAAARKGGGEQQLGFFNEPGYANELEGNSWGGIVHDARRVLADLDPTDQANAKVIAVLKTMTDDPDRSGLWHGTEPLSADALTRWFLKEHAPRAAEINRRYQEAVKRGVTFDFRQGDAYDPALYQDLHGPETMVVADPPYFGTTGYGNDEAAEGTKSKDIVGLDIYRKTRDLMQQLAQQGHSVLYTDEAWWLKPDIGKNLTDGAMNDGTRMASDIANSLDLTVVDGKIDSRYETLGLHNGQQPRANNPTAEAARGEGAPGPAETGVEPGSPLAEPANAPAAEGARGSGDVGGERPAVEAGRPIHGPAAEPSPMAGPDLAEIGPAGSDRGASPAGNEGQVGEEGERLSRGQEDQRPQAADTPVAPAGNAGGDRGDSERAAGRSGRAEESPLAGSPGESRQPTRSTVDAGAVRAAMDAARDGFDDSKIKARASKKDVNPGDKEARRQRNIAEARDKAEAAPLLEALEQHARDNGIDPNEPHVGFLPAPENPETLRHQRDQLEAGRRMAMLYTPGEKELPVPPGMQRRVTHNGVYHYDPSKISGQTLFELDRAGRQNQLLNLGPQNKAEIAASGQRPQVVTERAPDGTEVRAAAVTPDRAQSTLEEMQKQATPGHKMAIESMEDVLARRPAFLPASKEASPLADRATDKDQGERYKGLTARTLATPNPETGIPETKKKYAGKFVDPADPLHKLILEHNGIDDEMANRLNDAIEAGEPVMIGYGHAKAGGEVTAAGRKQEQKASSARARLQDASTAQAGDKVVVPTSFDISQDGSLNLNTFDFDKYNQNAQHLLEFMQEHLPEDAAKLGFNSIDDRAYQEAAQDYALNHAHGYRGDGSAPLRPTADVPTGYDPSYKPRRILKETADFLNAAYGNTSAMSEKSAGGAQARELAKANETYPTTPEPLPDVNPLRARINAMVDADGRPLFRVTREDGTVDEGYKDVIEPVNSTLKAGLVDNIVPAKEALRDTGIRQVGEAMSPFAEGPLPKGKFAAAGFLPKAEEGGEAEKRKNLRDLLDRYDEGDDDLSTARDLADELHRGTLEDELPQDLEDAVRRFEDEVRQDNQEFAGRNDMDQAEEQLISAARAIARGSAPQFLPKAEGEEGLRGWMDSSGKFRKVSYGEEHDDLARRLLNYGDQKPGIENYNDASRQLYRKGWVRVNPFRSDALIANTENGTLPPKAKRELINRAIENGLNAVWFDNNVKPQVIWTRAEDQGPNFLPGRFDDNRRQQESPLADNERTDAMGTRSRDVTKPGQAGTTLRFGEPTQPEGRLHAAEDGLQTKPYDNGSVTGPGAFFLPAYHGTGHKFDKFDISKIGTGEGAQVYGWGLYFASQKKTALEYRRNLSGGNKLEYDGKLYDRSDHSQMEDFVDKAMERIPDGPAREAAMEVLMDWSLSMTGDIHPDIAEGIARGVAEEHELGDKQTKQLIAGLKSVADGFDGSPVRPYAGDATNALVPRFQGGKRAVNEADAATKIAWNALRDRIGTRDASKWTQAKIEEEIQRNIDTLQTRINAGKLEIENRRKQKSGPAIGRAFDANAVLEGAQRDWVDALKLLKDGTVKFNEEEPPGHHYEVDLKTDDDSLLQYDKSTLSQHRSVTEKILDAIRENVALDEDLKPDPGDPWAILMKKYQDGVYMGAQFYNDLSTRLVFDKYGKNANLSRTEMDDLRTRQGPKAASEWLLAAGIDGIKYADGFTRNKAGAKTHNYVLFSDQKIEVLKRNERPLPSRFDEAGQGRLAFLPAKENGARESDDDLSRRERSPLSPLGDMEQPVIGIGRDNNEVLGRIIAALPVDVMDALAEAKLTPEDVLSDQSVLGDLPAADATNVATKVGVAIRRALPDAHAGLGTVSGEFSAKGIDPEWLRADATGERDHARGSDKTGQKASQFLPASEDSEDGFYSQLARVLEAKMPRSATAAQVRGIVDPAKGSGVKPEEIKWSGLEDYLANAGDKVSKEDLLAHIRDQAPKFGETTYGHENAPPEWDFSQIANAKEEMAEEVMRTMPDQMKDEGSADWHQRLRDRAANISDTAAKARLDGDWYEDRDPQYAIAGEMPKGSPKFSQYVSPGGTNYREKVRTMESPPKPGDKMAQGTSAVVHFDNEKAVDDYLTHISAEGLEHLDYGAVDEGNGERRTVEVDGIEPEDWAKLREWAERYGGRIEGERKVDLNRKADEYRSSHFGDAGDYIYHTRVSDAQDAEGQPGTLIHEIQSDRHQKARKEGYKGDQVPNKYTVKDNPNRGTWDVVDAAGNRIDSYQTRQEAEDIIARSNPASGTVTSTGIPDAPFRKDWALQGFKDNLKDAVAAGHKWIGWDDGQTNADRYSLSQQVREIGWQPGDPGMTYVTVAPKGGEEIELFVDKDGKVTDSTNIADARGKSLDDLLGKDVATKIMAEKRGNLSGEGLNIGGEGMKAFYDKILPAEVAKYVKKWGVKPEFDTGSDNLPFEVREAGMPDQFFATREEAESFMDDNGRDNMSLIEKTPGKLGRWVVPITPEMAASVKQGQPRYLPELEDKHATPVKAGSEPYTVRRRIIAGPGGIGIQIRRSDYKNDDDWARAVNALNAAADEHDQKWASEAKKLPPGKSLSADWDEPVTITPTQGGSFKFRAEMGKQTVGYGNTEEAAIKAAERTYLNFRKKKASPMAEEHHSQEQPRDDAGRFASPLSD